MLGSQVVVSSVCAIVSSISGFLHEARIMPLPWKFREDVDTKTSPELCVLVRSATLLATLGAVEHNS